MTKTQTQRLLLIVLIMLTILSGVGSYPAAHAQVPDDAYQEALDRILAATDTGATELDLSYLGLTELPPEISQLQNLQELDLESNRLTDLPPEIGQFANLQKLDVSCNELTELPPEIGQLANLQVLYLGWDLCMYNNNFLTSLPPEIFQLHNLRVLYVP